MTKKEEAKALYDGKFFYEINKTTLGSDGKISLELTGPSDDIYFATPLDGKPTDIVFLKIVEGVPQDAYTNAEILVTNHKL